MDIIILGLLMLRGMTIYEIRKTFEEQLTFASSSSTGAIQAALKRLKDKGVIHREEKQEGKVKKKYYYITEAGIAYFLERINQPRKNNSNGIELGKLMFMNYAPQERWLALIDSYVGELQEEQQLLEVIVQMSEARDLDDRAFFEEAVAMLSPLGGAKEYNNITELRNASFFGMAALNYGVKALAFEIDFYNDLKKQIREYDANLFKR